MNSIAITGYGAKDEVQTHEVNTTEQDNSQGNIENILANLGQGFAKFYNTLTTSLQRPEVKLFLFGSVAVLAIAGVFYVVSTTENLKAKLQNIPYIAQKLAYDAQGVDYNTIESDGKIYGIVPVSEIHSPESWSQNQWLRLKQYWYSLRGKETKPALRPVGNTWVVADIVPLN